MRDHSKVERLRALAQRAAAVRARLAALREAGAVSSDGSDGDEAVRREARLLREELDAVHAAFNGLRQT